MKAIGVNGRVTAAALRQLLHSEAGFTVRTLGKRLGVSRSALYRALAAPDDFVLHVKPGNMDTVHMPLEAVKAGEADIDQYLELVKYSEEKINKRFEWLVNENYPA